MDARRGSFFSDRPRMGWPSRKLRSASAGPQTAQSDAAKPNEMQQEHTNGVVPVEELEPPFLARQFLRVGPRAPTQHRNDAHQHRDRIGFHDDHNLLNGERKATEGVALLRKMSNRLLT